MKCRRSTNHAVIFPGLLAIVCLLTAVPPAAAGTLTNVSVTPASLVAGATTTYAVSFRPVGTINSGDFIILWTESGGTGGPNVESATLNALSGGGLSGTNSFKTANRFVVWLNGGTATSSTTVTVTIGNVVNPGTAGTGPNYKVQTTDGSSEIDSKILSGSTYISNPAPTVVDPIDDLTLAAEDGPTVVVADLNTVFTDGDGDPMTFSVEPGHDTAIATASVAGSQLTVTGISRGTTTITVKADDTPAGGEGSITDSFDVTVLGLLTPADVQPASLQAGATGSVVITLKPQSALNGSINDQIVVVYPAGFTVNTATLGTISPATAGIQLFANASNSVLRLTSGSFAANASVSITLNNITNPGAAGNPGGYTIRAQDSGDSVFAIATLPGDTFTPANAPTVTTPIPDQTLAAEDGATVVVADLNTVFTDGDGDPMTFSVLPGHDTAIATASVAGSQLTVTGLTSGTTTVTVEADDTPSGTGEGSVTDSFDVAVLGLLTPADVQPDSLTAGATGSVTVTLTPSTTLSGAVQDQILVLYPPGFTVNTATLGTITPATATLQLFANASNSLLRLTAGSFTAGATVTIVLHNVTNPAAPGSPGDYTVRAQDSGDGVFAIATIPGDTFAGLPGDANGNMALGLDDVVLFLQVSAGQTPSSAVDTGGDIDGDGKIGMVEGAYVLRELAGP